MLHTDFSRPFLNAPGFLVVGDPMHFGAHNREKHLTSSLRRNLRTVGQSTHPGLSIGQPRFAMLALEGLCTFGIHSHASAVDGEGGPQVRFMLVQ